MVDVDARTDAKHVIIVGGGFAGLACASRLAAHGNIKITLIDKNNYQQFQPLLYQVAASILSPSNAAFALRDLFRNHENVDVHMDEVAFVDLRKRTVRTAAGKTFNGDFLVLATGSKVNFYDVPGAEQNTFPLYSLVDAERLRSIILETFEARDGNPASQNDGLLNFVVVGGGPTGVEMAGTLGDMSSRMLQKEFRHLRNIRAQVWLIERGSSVLKIFSPASRNYALSALREHGVRVVPGTAVTKVAPDRVTLSDGSEILTRTVVWAAGLKAESIAANPILPLLPNGRVVVQKDLSVPGFDCVFVAGDLANAYDVQGNVLPQLAAVAQQAGRSCADNIVAQIDGKPSHPFVYSDRGILAMIGRNAAVAELGQAHHELAGPMAFFAWLGIHAALLTTARAKLEAIIEWAWEYFLGEHAGQIIHPLEGDWRNLPIGNSHVATSAGQ